MRELISRKIKDSYIFNKKWNSCLNILIYLSYIIILSYILYSYYDKLEFLHISEEQLKKLQDEKLEKVVVYSCLIGGYDSISSFPKEKGFNYILFTDQRILNTNWTVLPIPKEVNDLPLTPVKKQRYIKTHPHKFFKNCELSIYIDANYIIKGNLEDFLENTLNPLDKIYITHLQFGKTPLKAIEKAIKQKLDEKNLLNEIKKRYPPQMLNKNGIVNAGLIVRKHNDEGCIKLMEKWWEEIEKYSHVDNFSFNYAAYETGVKFLYISYQFTLDYFDHSKHLIKPNY